MVRLKHRYLLVNILYPDLSPVKGKPGIIKHDVPLSVQFRQPSSDQLTAKILVRMIRDGVAELFGDYGSGMVSASLLVKYFSPATSTAIVRVARAHYRLVWAALSFTTQLPKPLNQACVMQVVRVSGTIRKAEEEAIRRARLSIVRASRASGKSATTFGATAVAADDRPGADMVNGIEDLDDPGDMDEDDED